MGRLLQSLRGNREPHPPMETIFVHYRFKSEANVNYFKRQHDSNGALLSPFLLQLHTKERGSSTSQTSPRQTSKIGHTFLDFHNNNVKLSLWV